MVGVVEQRKESRDEVRSDVSRISDNFWLAVNENKFSPVSESRIVIASDIYLILQFCFQPCIHRPSLEI